MEWLSRNWRLSAVLFACAVGGTAWADDGGELGPRLYRKPDGSACVVYVEAGQLAERCEAAKPADTPLVEAVPTRKARLLDEGLAPRGREIDLALISTASMKYGWSGALKLGAITSALAAAINFGFSYWQAGWIQVVIGAVCLVAGISLDVSAANDMRMADTYFRGGRR